MASPSVRRQGQHHAYDSILSTASTFFGPAASRPSPCQRAPESNLPPADETTSNLAQSASSAIYTNRLPPASPPANGHPERDLLFEPKHGTPDDRPRRRRLEARSPPRIFNNSNDCPLRHAAVAQPWPPRRDSLSTPVSGVR